MTKHEPGLAQRRRCENRYFIAGSGGRGHRKILIRIRRRSRPFHDVEAEVGSAMAAIAAAGQLVKGRDELAGILRSKRSI